MNWYDFQLYEPEPNKLCLVQAYESGCKSMYFVAFFFKSSLPGQDGTWYLDSETYRLPIFMHTPEVHKWVYID